VGCCVGSSSCSPRSQCLQGALVLRRCSQRVSGYLPGIGIDFAPDVVSDTLARHLSFTRYAHSLYPQTPVSCNIAYVQSGVVVVVLGSLPVTRGWCTPPSDTTITGLAVVVQTVG
jgi:hypothetical protein